MASDDVKLIGSWPSPFVHRARIALNIKSIDYEFLEEQFDLKNEILFKSELLLKSNPVHKKIPVLIHGDKPICESLIIVQYIDEVWNSEPSILPFEPYDRAIARFWAAYIDDKLWPALSSIGIAEEEEAKKAAIETVNEIIALFEDAFVNCSKGKIFFGGDKIGFLDIAFGSNLAWIKYHEKSNKIKLIDEIKTPNLFKWAELFGSDPAVKDVIPEVDKLSEFAKLLFAMLKARQH